MSPVVLVILIAWALLSVIFLTGTLLAARSIDRSVSGVTNRVDENGKPEKNIADTVEEIGKEGKFIDEARKTVQISSAIRKAADPVSGHLARTLTIASKGIDPRLKSVNNKVLDILDVAGKINTNVVSINGSVDSIHSDVLEINDTVRHIGKLGLSIRTSATEINGSARSILGNLSAILARVESIDEGAATINARAATILSVAGPIGKDLSSVLANVGTENGTNTVTGHANGIDCSTLLLGTQSCNK